VTLTELLRSSEHSGNHTAGWLISVLLHGSVVVGAFFFVQRVQLAPQSEPFKWNVALVSPVSPSTPSSPSSSLAQNLAPTPAETPTPSTTSRKHSAPPVTEPTNSEPLQSKPPVMTATALPTPLTQAEPQPVKPVPQTMAAAPQEVVKSVDPVPPATVPTPVAPPLPVEPRTHTPTPVESVSPSHQTIHSETMPVPPQGESDPTMAITPAHPEPPTLTSPVATASPEPATSITTHVTTPPSETSVPAASSATQVAALAPPGSNRPARIDYGWLKEAILRRVEELKRYPAEARVDRAEGKVVVQAVINADGSVDDVEISQSSGSATLDKAAVDLMRRAAHFPSLPHSLEKPRVTVKIPINYRLDDR
jgi:periplasmic protein TonB